MDMKNNDSKKKEISWIEQGKRVFDIAFVNALHDHRSVYKALVQLSKESGIPYKTLKEWFEERRESLSMAVVTEVKDRVIRKIPLDVDKELRIEAARRNLSVNDLVVNILEKEARRLQKKRG